jgi:hypothetical protein
MRHRPVNPQRDARQQQADEKVAAHREIQFHAGSKDNEKPHAAKSAPGGVAAHF